MTKEMAPHQFQQYSNEAFQKAKVQSHWMDSRGIKKDVLDNSSPGYAEILPTWNQLDLLDTIQQKINTPHEGPISIVDIGCGPTAKFLHDCKHIWKADVTCTGLNAVIQPTTQEQASIQLIEHNIQTPEQIIPPKCVDIITCTLAICYVTDPFQLLETIHSLLKPNTGIAFVSHIPITPVIPEMKHQPQKTDELFQHMKDNLHMNINRIDNHHFYFGNDTLCHISWQHDQHTNFSFPLTRTGKFIHHHIRIGQHHVHEVDTVKYALTS